MSGTKWEFNQEVTEIFENMLKRSIPQYDVMRQSVVNIALRFIKKGGKLLDLGSSKGDSVCELIELLPIDFILTETSQPMLEHLKNRFKREKNVYVEELDLRHQFPIAEYCVVQSILTLQFIPIEYRQQIITDIYKNLSVGGVFIFVEKLLGNTADLNRLMVDEYYDMKEKKGYTQAEIDRKRLQLEGILVPVTAKWNEELLIMAGFRQIDCFWRWMNFAGWIAIK